MSTIQRPSSTPASVETGKIWVKRRPKAEATVPTRSSSSSPPGPRHGPIAQPTATQPTAAEPHPSGNGRFPMANRVDLSLAAPVAAIPQKACPGSVSAESRWPGLVWLLTP